MTLADPLLDKPEVATALRLNNRAIEGLHRSRQLPGVVIAGKLGWRLSAVEAFVQGRESNGRAVVRRPAGTMETAMAGNAAAEARTR